MRQRDKALTVTQVGTRSTLFKTYTKCLCAFSLRRYSTTGLQRVPIGSRASRTCMTTSEESNTLYSSPQIRREVPLAYIGSR